MLLVLQGVSPGFGGNDGPDVPGGEGTWRSSLGDEWSPQHLGLVSIGPICHRSWLTCTRKSGYLRMGKI